MSLPSRPLRMAARVTSSVENMKTSPPHARKKLPSASEGGLEGNMDLGGESQRKKYVRQRRAEKPTKRFPHNEWIWTWNRYVWKWAAMAAPVTPITRAGKGLKLPV